jgi:hypothetical protein
VVRHPFLELPVLVAPWISRPVVFMLPADLQPSLIRSRAGRQLSQFIAHNVISLRAQMGERINGKPVLKYVGPVSLRWTWNQPAPHTAEAATRLPRP